MVDADAPFSDRRPQLCAFFAAALVLANVSRLLDDLPADAEIKACTHWALLAHGTRFVPGGAWRRRRGRRAMRRSAAKGAPSTATSLGRLEGPTKSADAVRRGSVYLYLYGR